MIRLTFCILVVIAITWFIAFQILPQQSEQIVKPIIEKLESRSHDQGEFVASVIFLETGLIMLVPCLLCLWLMKKNQLLLEWPKVMVWTMIYVIATIIGLTLGSWLALLINPSSECWAMVAFLGLWLLFGLIAVKITARLKDQYEAFFFRSTGRELKEWKIALAIALECFAVIVLLAVARVYFPI